MNRVAILPPREVGPENRTDDTVMRMVAVLPDAVIVNWDEISIEDDGKVDCRSALNRQGGSLELAGPIHPTLFYFYMTSGNHKAKLDRVLNEHHPSKRLLSEIIDVPYNKLCLNLLSTISKSGIPTNYESDSARWGVKGTFETRCKEFEGENESRVPRPKTVILRLSDDRDKAAEFLRGHRACLLKPYNGARAEGIRVITTLDEVASVNPGWYVLQEMVQKAPLYHGKRFALRAYLIIDDLRVPRYTIAPQTVVKFAMKPYGEGEVEADSVICSSAYAVRRGTKADAEVIDNLGTWGQQHKPMITEKVGEALAALMGAVSWRARIIGSTPPVRLLWGIDLVIDSGEENKAKILDVNPFPMLYRGSPTIDAAIDDVLKIWASSSDQLDASKPSAK